MKIKVSILAFLISCFLTFSFAQINSVDEIFKNKKEIYFKFNLQNSELMHQLTQTVSIDNVIDNEVIAVANKSEFELFLEFNIDYQILPSPFELFPAEIWEMTDSYLDKTTRNWNAYPTYQAYLDLMAQFQNNFPNLCKIDTIGYSVEGRLLLAAKITSNVNVSANKPEFLYTSTMHGDETVGYVLMLRLIDYLLNNYSTNSRITNLLNNVIIYINPLANPDGTYAAGNNTVVGATRNNANSFDLNRNFPSPNGNATPNGTRQLETQNFMNWAQSRNFVMAANFHGGAELINYPWDYTTFDHADKNWWIYVSKEYADTAQANSPANYFVDFPTGADFPGVTEGANWYVIIGSRQDYVNYFAQTRELTAEISTIKNPAASTLTDYWNYNFPSLINYIEQVKYGFRGVVTDSCTNLPIIAKIELLNHDTLNSHVYTTLPFGSYFRPVKAGNYSIRVSAPGYQSSTLNNLIINDKSTIVHNFTLKPLAPVVDFFATNNVTCSGIVQFNNNSVATANSTFLWNFGDNNTSNLQNPTHTYQTSGLFNVQLIITNCIGSDTLTKYSYIQVALVDTPLVDNQSRCDSGTVTFNAISNFNVNWWNNDQSQILHTGNTFTTPILSQDENYYVSASYSIFDTISAGMQNRTVNGTFFTGTTSHGLIFNVNQALTLKSVRVWANSSGVRTINLLDANSNIINTISINIPNGESRVNLNFSIPVGNNYRLVASSSPSLWRDGGTSAPTLSYPFNSQNNEVSVIGNTANNLSIYYFFYDWEVELQNFCQSTKKPVFAYIHYTPNPSFTYTELLQEVTFINTSTGGGSYFWDFGDLNSSTLENPVHTYATANYYYVTLTQTNTCGLQSNQEIIFVTKLDDILTSKNLNVYPNPSDDYFNITSEFVITNVKIFDLQGREIYTDYSINQKSAILNTEKLEKGIYLLKVYSESKASFRKIIVK